jgi:hypothetical protein
MLATPTLALLLPGHTRVSVPLECESSLFPFVPLTELSLSASESLSWVHHIISIWMGVLFRLAKSMTPLSESYLWILTVSIHFHVLIPER